MIPLTSSCWLAFCRQHHVEPDELREAYDAVEIVLPRQRLVVNFSGLYPLVMHSPKAGSRWQAVGKFTHRLGRWHYEVRA